jgi:hypothetical protein
VKNSSNEVKNGVIRVKSDPGDDVNSYRGSRASIVSSITLGDEEKLSVTREEVVKGVIIKGIVCTPKTEPKSKSKPVNTEKRAAPKPPVQDGNSVPKTKPKNKKRS